MFRLIVQSPLFLKSHPISILRPEVLVTHTKDLGQVIGGVHTASSKIGGEIDIPYRFGRRPARTETSREQNPSSTDYRLRRIPPRGR
jgi:hypothetical protein